MTPQNTYIEKRYTDENGGKIFSKIIRYEALRDTCMERYGMEKRQTKNKTYYDKQIIGWEIDKF